MTNMTAIYHKSEVKMSEEMVLKKLEKELL